MRTITGLLKFNQVPTVPNRNKLYFMIYVTVKLLIFMYLNLIVPRYQNILYYRTSKNNFFIIQDYDNLEIF